jgi:hypothetical protein
MAGKGAVVRRHLSASANIFNMLRRIESGGTLAHVTMAATCRR